MKSRKFWSCVVSGALFTWMQISGKIPADGVVYSNLMFVVLGALVAGNVGDKFAQRQK